jgi:hypothetical protein
MAHTDLVQDHPALAKIVFSDQLRLNYPSLRRRFAAIYDNYSTHLQVLTKQARRPGATLIPADDAVAIFLALIQGFAFQTAIARTSIDVSRLPQQMFIVFHFAITGVAPTRSSGPRRAASGRRK